MITIKKVKSGLILFEDYSVIRNIATTNWTFHPSYNRFFVDLTNNQLNISHGLSPSYMLRDLPNKFVFEMQNEYNPLVINDMGGIVIYEADDEKLELYEYYNETVGTTNNYPYVRLRRNGNLYDGYGSQDGSNWEIRGSIYYEYGNKIGLAVEGANGDNMKVNKICIYEDTKITLKAMPTDSYLLLRINDQAQTEIGTFFESDHEVTVDLFNYSYPLDLTFEIYNQDRTLFAGATIDEVFGGDEYHCGNFLEVFYNDELLDVMNNDFGYIDSFYKDYRLEVRNMINVNHYNVNLDIKKYQNEFGDEWIQVCKDADGIPNLQFAKSITFDVVPASSSVYFWIRITRGAITSFVDDYLFDFAISVY